MSHAATKVHGLTRLRVLLLKHPDGISRADILSALADLEVNDSTVFRWLQEVKARRVRQGVYTLDPTEEDIEVARAVIARID